MKRRRRWWSERRSALAVVAAWVERQESFRAAAEALEMSRQNLWVWLNDPGKSWSPATCLRVAKIVGVPAIALLFKSDPIGSVLRKMAA